MSKRLIIILIKLLPALFVNAQKGNNNISSNAESNFPIESLLPFAQKETGFGFFLKGFYDVCKSGQCIKAEEQPGTFLRTANSIKSFIQ